MQAEIDPGSSPTVSVIVVNFNLGCFLREAVASVYAQTYRNVECIVVDDASTDRSQEVIAELRTTFPGLRPILRTENGGSTLASLDGLKASSGQFVHFLDADDLLLPAFIETHVAVHLDLRFPVGFSCSDMLFQENGTILASGDTNIARFIAAPRRRAKDGGASPAALLPDARERLSERRVYEVFPEHRGWPWSATSAIVYRRRALALFAEARHLDLVRQSTDAFFCHGINAITGSVIIDASLSVYRSHGANSHLRGTPLNHCVNFDLAERHRKSTIVFDALLAHVIEDCARFERLFWHPQGYYQLLSRICRQHPRQGRVALVIARHFQHLSATFGPALTACWLVGAKTRY